MPAAIQSTHLEFVGGSSDKEYNISLVLSGTFTSGPAGEALYDVPFSFGPRGAPGQGGKLNKNGPVSWSVACTLFEKQRRAKLAKGYVETDSTSATIVTDVRKEKTDWLPQLCNDVEERGLESLLANPAVCLEQKYDGKRIQIVKGYDGDTHGINRKGEKVGLPKEIADRVNTIEGRVHLDGEQVNSSYVAWDVLRRQARDHVTGRTQLCERRASLERYRRVVGALNLRK